MCDKEGNQHLNCAEMSLGISGISGLNERVLHTDWRSGEQERSSESLPRVVIRTWAESLKLLLSFKLVYEY